MELCHIRELEIETMRSQRQSRTETGTVIVLVAIGTICLLGATALAVDVGYFYHVQSQMQNAVDAAALAGAQGMLADPGDVSESGRAKQLATEAAAQNRAASQTINLSPDEITFPRSNTIRVQMTRPIRTFFGRVFGVQFVNARVRATSTVAPVMGVAGGPNGGGIRPWAIMDQFGHGSLCVPPNDADVNPKPHGPFNDRPHIWNGVTVASDHYASPYDAQFDEQDLSSESDCARVTGLVAPRDVNGVVIRLKDGDPRVPGNFGIVALDGRGADSYRDLVVDGYDGFVQVGDTLETEPGGKTGPTIQGVEGLVALDPDARMVRNSAGRWVVTSSRYPLNESPRIVPVPIYSVFTAPDHGRTTFVVTNIASFFVEGSDGHEVWGRFVQGRAKNGRAGDLIEHGSGQAVGGGGRQWGTVRLVELEN
jgi:hypothetical protein